MLKWRDWALLIKSNRKKCREEEKEIGITQGLLFITGNKIFIETKIK